MTATNGRKPKTGDRPLRVQFRNGWISKHTYVADALVWADRGWDFGVVAVERA